MIFQALAWHARDEDDGHGPHLISVVGKDACGKSVCVTTEFKPYFFVRLPETFTQRDVKILLDEIRERCPDCLEGHGIVRKKDVMGFTNNEERLFLKLDARNLASRRAMDGFFRYRKKHLTVYESNIEPTLRLLHRTGIQSVGWLEVGQYNPAFYATTDIDVFCDDWRELKPVEGRDEDVAPFVVASFDIEAYSERKQFPDANLPGDACYQIAMTLCKYGESEPFDRVCFCHKETADVPEGRIEWFDTEREVLEAWAKYVHEKNVDVITGYNIFGFDFSFLFTRAVMVRCAPSFYNLGRIRNTPSNITHKNLSSSALGDNTLKLLPMPGRFIFDLFHLIKSQFKLDSFKLEYVATHFLKDQGKYDMPAKEMFRRYEVGDAKELGDVAAYCIQDTLLLHLLMAKLSTLQSLWEMARACHVSLSHLVERGQQVKVFSQLTRKARELGYMVPVIRQDRSSLEDGYQGATVLDPIPGAYFTPIVALDFASLYPSIMCAHNMCYSTLVLDDRRYGNIPGVEYDTFVVDGKTYKFAQGVPSLLPVILTELKAYRKKAKKEMASTTDPFKKSILDGRQLAYKVSMNSVYGFTGTVRGMLPCVAIASSVTCRGRGMIEETKAYCEKHFNAKVRYGDTDSVFVEFDLEGRDPMSKEALDFAWSLGEKAAEQCSALFRPPNDLELEKVYRPLILYSKKRYAAKLWTMHKDGEMHMDYVDVKGLQLKRRDGTKHMRRVCTELLDVILDSSDTKRPTELAKERALELIEGKIGMEELTLSQSLAAEYKNPNLSHVVVRDKMKARAPGSEPQPGDRVPYVFIKTPDPRAKAYEKAEDPLWVQSHGDEIKIDYYHYFTNKYVEPISQLLQPLLGDGCKQLLFGDIIKRFKPPRQKKQIKGQTTLDALFKNYAKITSKTKDHGVLDKDCGDAQGGSEQSDSVTP